MKEIGMNDEAPTMALVLIQLFIERVGQSCMYGKSGFENSLHVKNAIICMDKKHGEVDKSHKLFLKMKDTKIVY